MEFEFFYIVTCLWTLLFAVSVTNDHVDTTTNDQLTEYDDFPKNKYAPFSQTFEQKPNYDIYDLLNTAQPRNIIFGRERAFFSRYSFSTLCHDREINL
ncbi:hypothetical protein [Enterococcus hirae]|uniref:hypothetical protein n=1 Tax=Enterococcus hirae TaxID=1354 RepID=UPI00159C3A39|nr:hypothetical protein [Enterococcus hirae]MBA5270547.1 hypothetical protein [Enterococcus hirae]MDU4894138.1 hypothetical protein [Enterococcus hirae]NVM00510.1 hypothetical protein [Enterococcus hirae]